MGGFLKKLGAAIVKYGPGLYRAWREKRDEKKLATRLQLTEYKNRDGERW